MSDVRLIENGSGGDFVLIGNDLETIGGFQNMVYLSLFGGNVEASTGDVVESEQRFDWWGNSVLFPNDPSIQFNSETERVLNEVALNSSGRLKIEQAVKSDLAHMQSFANIDVSVSITGENRIEIYIRIQQPDNQQLNEIVYIWDAAQSELTSVDNTVI